MTMKSAIAVATIGASVVLLPLSANAQSANVITLTQTPCQFLETEGTDHGYTSTSKADCEKINAKSGDARVAKSKVITLKPGDYTFRVTNKNVPYNLGFWLRGQGVIGRATLPSVSGGGLSTGASKDYKISLKPGKYYFSCPLNSTPDYQIEVEG